MAASKYSNIKKPLFHARTIAGLFFLFSSSAYQAQNWDKYAVMLGEKNWNDKVELKKNNCSVVTIRIDGDGNYYPNLFIEDKSMKKADGNLVKWYQKNPEAFKSILKSHNIDKSDKSIQQLNKSIEENYVKLIDSAAAEKEVVFIIHGYRKQMYKQKDNALSMKENDIVEKYLGSNKVFVEIYWDSKHITLFKGAAGKKILRMMEASAVPNAVRVGQQLRSLVSAIDKTEIAIISHSLGSVVANELSFNYSDEMDYMDGKELNMAYLAPAIGYESFSNASKRGSGNYKLNTCVVYNNDDFVLKKDFSAFGKQIDTDATTYGNTSLGCNHDGDIMKLLQLYKTKHTTETPPLLIDMSGRINHNFSYYTKHRAFSEVMEFLFD